MKTCTKCGETKLKSEFYKHKSGRDGLCPDCKDCIRQRTRDWNRLNKESHRARSKKWAQDNRERVNERGRLWSKNNPEKAGSWRLNNRERVNEINRRSAERRPHKVRVNRLIGNRIVSGKISRPKCCSVNDEYCSGKIEAHHHDYNNPFDIHWLCKAHHTAFHRLFITEGELLLLE